MKKILLLGKNSQLGWELQRSLTTIGNLIAFGQQEIDLSQFDKLKDCIRTHRPDFIINAAAYTAVDKAELEPELAQLINAEAVKILAEESRRLNAWLVYYSTDYVFDGNKSSAYIETDPTYALSVYGRTKLAGEQFIYASKCKYLILRSSWIYSIHRANFPLAILKCAINNQEISVINDSFGAPTSANLIADITAMILYRIIIGLIDEKSTIGTYHLVASGSTSWYEYAKLLVNLAIENKLPIQITPNKILAVTSDTFTNTAKRPKNSVLNNNKIQDNFGFVLPAWQRGVERLILELSQSKIQSRKYFLK